MLMLSRLKAFTRSPFSLMLNKLSRSRNVSIVGKFSSPLQRLPYSEFGYGAGHSYVISMSMYANGYGPLRMLSKNVIQTAYCFKCCKCNNKLFGQGCNFIPIRTLKSVASANLGDPIVGDRFRLQDRISKKYELIYRTSLPNYLLSGQVANFTLYFVVLFMILSKLAEDENEEKPSREEIVAKNVEREKSLKKTFGMDPEHKVSELPKARFEEAVFDVEDSSLLVVALGLTMLSLVIGFTKLLHRIPVRLYLNPQGHCIGIYYGHLIPFRTTRKEFVAGTLRKSEKKSALTDSLYVDPQGNGIILLEHCFRYPNDFRTLLHPSTAKLESSKNIKEKINSK